MKKTNVLKKVWDKLTGIDKVRRWAERTVVKPEKIDLAYVNKLVKKYHLNLSGGDLIPIFNKKKDKFDILVSYRVYIRKVQKISKDFQGFNVQTFLGEKGQIFSAQVTIYRKSWKEPFVYTAYYDEFYSSNGYGDPVGFWATMPNFMISKVAITLGLRYAFSDITGELPFTNDEMK